MATTVSVNPQDVAAAANILEQFLGDSVPDGDFGQGTALRDLTVGAIASIFAFLRKENTQVRQLQSLNSVAAATSGDPEALRDAVTAILSNVFISLKSGSKARGSVVGHASSQVDIFVPTNIKFTKAAGLVFLVDSDSSYFISKDELVPIIDSDGAVLEYQFRIPLVATKTGETYNVDPGLFTSFERFNAFVTRIENTDKFSGGKGPETVAEVLERAPTAISVRNLINDRSIQAVLNDNFDNIQGIFVAGMGMPEMQRDRLIGLTGSLQLHVGGMVDIYLLLDLSETSFTGIVGDLFLRPDGLNSIFRDAGTDLTPVQAGDIIRVTAGLEDVPAEFMVIDTNGTELVVSDRSPFPIATDEQSPTGAVSYTIGRVGPSYVDVVSDSGAALTSGTTSRRVQKSGRITLPGGPVMDILDVALLNPPLAETAFKDPLDGFVHFSDRVNGDPSDAVVAPASLQFSVHVNNPLEAQSPVQWMEIQVGTDDDLSRFDGYQLRVRYRTLSTFSTIDSFVRGRRERTACANQLPRGHHPVLVSMNLSYKLKATATSLLNDAVIVQTIVDFINSFDTSVAPIDTSAVETLVRNTFPTIASIAPLVIGYTLSAPTGDLVGYSTVDEVVVDPTKQVSGPTGSLASYGVTNRTIRYIADTTSVTAQRAS